MKVEKPSVENKKGAARLYQNPEPILSKRQFVREYKAGHFGNAAPTWNNLDEWLQDKTTHAKGLFHIRNRVAGGPTWYNLQWRSVYDIWTNLVEKTGLDYSSLYISAMAPHDRGTIQGEVMQSIDHLELTYTSAKRPMRDAFAEFTATTRGIDAVRVLKHYMCPNSWDWLNYLLDAYPGHVIEFSCFSVNWGTIPHENTVWWEVRGGY